MNRPYWLEGVTHDIPERDIRVTEDVIEFITRIMNYGPMSRDAKLLLCGYLSASLDKHCDNPDEQTSGRA